MAEVLAAMAGAAIAIGWSEWRLRREAQRIHDPLSHLWKHHLEDHRDE